MHTCKSLQKLINNYVAITIALHCPLVFRLSVNSIASWEKMAMEIREMWGELGPQIIELAGQEVDNHWIQDTLEDLAEELPEGECYK